MRGRSAQPWLWIGAALAAACGPSFEPQSAITKLRVLAVQADPAELILESGKPAPRTTLTALAVDPTGASPTARFALCEVLGLPSADLDCPGSAGLDLPPSGPQAAVLDLGDPRYAALAQGLAQGADGGTLSPAEEAALLAQGVPLVLGFIASAPALPGGRTPQTLAGLGDVVVRTADPARSLNHNPALRALSLGGAELPVDGSATVPPGATLSLSPLPAADAKEPTADGPEKLNFSFYATGGKLKSLRSADTTATGEAANPAVDYTAPAGAGPVQLWVVVRDGRGGVGWLTRTVQVR